MEGREVGGGQARMLIGLALYIDTLKPVFLLSLTLQGDEINVAATF